MIKKEGYRNWRKELNITVGGEFNLNTKLEGITAVSDKIVFVSNRGDGEREQIYIMNSDGSNVKKLTNNPNEFGADKPRWSLDGKKIVFVWYDGDAEICVMNADGSDQTKLTNNSTYEYDPCWSPDGKKIAFVSNRDGNHEIYVMNADGSGIERLTNNPGVDLYPSWSPEG